MDFVNKNPGLVTIGLSGLLLIAVVIFAFVHIFARPDTQDGFTVSGNTTSDYRVFYLPNEFWPDNPVNHNLGFLMSFTDFIEVDSRFNAQLDGDAEIFYSYNAVKTFVIRYMGSVDGTINPVVFREVFELSQASGSAHTDRLSFPNGTGISGTYTIFPKDYTDLYLNFVAAQGQQMRDENVIATGLRGFSAELLIDFTYNIRIPEKSINETVALGYRLSLTTEVFTLTTTGNVGSTFSITIGEGGEPAPVALFTIVILVIFAGLGVYGLVRGLDRFNADPNPRRREANTIIKKYSNEIVVSDTLLSLQEYKALVVKDFETLLRLAINLNKHIMCYNDDNRADFAVIVDSYAYHFGIEYSDYSDDDYTEVEVSEVVETPETAKVDSKG